MAVNSFREDEAVSDVAKSRTLLRLFAYLLAYKKKIVMVLVVMAFVVGVQLLNPLLIEAGIDRYIMKGNFQGLLTVILTGIVLNAMVIFCLRFRMNQMNQICNDILVTIRQELYTHIQGLDLSFFDSRPKGKILARIIGDINSLRDVLSNCVTTLLPDFITVLAVVVIMLVKDPLLTLAALCSLPLLIGGLWFIQVASHKRWQIYRKKVSNMTAFIHESLSGMQTIQHFTAEPETKDTFQDLTQEYRKSFNDAVFYADAFFPVTNICWGIGAAALYFVGLRVLGIERVSVGTFIAFSTYIGMFWQPIMNLSNFYNQIVTNIAAAERVFEILDTPPEIKDAPGAYDLDAIEGAVEFDHVSFAYPDAPDVPVLKDVSFRIRPGETIALVGPTGAGKTTIVNLLSRFYDTAAGQILIDGNDISKVTLESLRSQMGIMTQDNFLFSETVAENIRYGRPDATDEEVIAAAKAVHAHDFILRMKDGYQTKLSERGGGLSIGQKQLLAFARTFVSMPRILILDEATSSIDTQTELLVQKGIEVLLNGRTSFVIAHRLSTVQKADRIFVVDEGGILEAGSPQELMAQRGAYFKLYMSQFAGV
jgi:ATP-binding cassette subfamily B protein